MVGKKQGEGDEGGIVVIRKVVDRSVFKFDGSERQTGETDGRRGALGESMSEYSKSLNYFVSESESVRTADLDMGQGDGEEEEVFFFLERCKDFILPFFRFCSNSVQVQHFSTKRKLL